jgi:methionine-rich copper-binding protein CopC
VRYLHITLAGVALLLGAAGAAFAHAHLQKSTPAEGSVLGAAPGTIVLSFSEPARITAFWIQKSGGEKQKIESLPSDWSRQVSVSMPTLAAGSYVASWRVVGQDSHIMPGELHFTITAR